MGIHVVEAIISLVVATVIVGLAIGKTTETLGVTAGMTILGLGMDKTAQTLGMTSVLLSLIIQPTQTMGVNCGMKVKTMSAMYNTRPTKVLAVLQRMATTGMSQIQNSP